MGPVDRFRVWRNRRVFSRLEQSIAAEKDLDRQVELARVAAAFARQSGCGSFSSASIEQAFLCRAASIGQVPVRPAVPGTVLMVMSEAYAWGGHTRAVERWIEIDSGRRYSVAVTRQDEKTEFPGRLRDAVERSGGKVEFLQSRGELRDWGRRLSLECRGAAEATVLGIPAGTVRFRLCYAKKLLREKLRPTFATDQTSKTTGKKP